MGQNTHLFSFNFFLATWPILGYLTIMSYICHRLELKQDEQSESAATCLCYRPRPATLAGRPATATRGSLSPSDCTIAEWALLWRAGRDGARWLSFVWWPANRSFNQTHRIGATAALARRARAWLLLLAALHCCCYSIASHLCMLFACLVTHYSILQGFY